MPKEIPEGTTHTRNGEYYKVTNTVQYYDLYEGCFIDCDYKYDVEGWLAEGNLQPINPTESLPEIEPYDVWLNNRQIALSAIIQECLDNGSVIPEHLVEEYNQHIEALEGKANATPVK